MPLHVILLSSKISGFFGVGQLGLVWLMKSFHLGLSVTKSSTFVCKSSEGECHECSAINADSVGVSEWLLFECGAVFKGDQIHLVNKFGFLVFCEIVVTAVQYSW